MNMEGLKIDGITKFLYCCLLILSISCNNNEKKHINLSKTEKRNESLKLVEDGVFSFRRSYIYSTETYRNEKYKNSLDNRNPENNFKEPKNNKYYKAIKELGLFDSADNLNLKKWNKIESIDKNGQKIFFLNKKYVIYINYLEKGVFSLKVNNLNGKNVLENKLKFELPPDVSFMIKDLDKDGNDEIISFYNWYFTNSDNYEIKIYKLEKFHK